MTTWPHIWTQLNANEETLSTKLVSNYEFLPLDPQEGTDVYWRVALKKTKETEVLTSRGR